MTRFRFAAIAALSTASLLVTATGGQAQREDTYRANTICKTRHTDGARAAGEPQGGRDFVIGITDVEKLQRGPGRRRGAAAFVPVQGAKVINKLKDLTTSNGDNVVDGKEVDRTNDNGRAKNKLEFDNFGNYRLKTKVKLDGDVVATDTVNFGVADRESGRCDPLTPVPARQ